MTVIQEGLLTFTFPVAWSALKYDDTTHYQSHFQSLANSKAVDIVAVSPAPDREIWLIEVKDYRANGRAKGLEFFTEMQIKVRDTLAGIFVAQRRPEAGALNTLSLSADGGIRVRVAVHLEQHRVVSKLRPAITDRANHRLKLRSTLRVVDSKAEICEIAAMPLSVGWAVAQV